MRLLIIFLIISATVNAQMTQKQQRRQNIKSTVITDVILISSVMLNAYGDAQNDNGNKEIGHFSNAASIACLLYLPLLQYKFNNKEWYAYGFKYIGIRFALFDPTYNLTRDLDFNYHGNSSLTDKAFKAPDGLNIFFRSISLGITLSIPINQY